MALRHYCRFLIIQGASVFMGATWCNYQNLSSRVQHLFRDPLNVLNPSDLMRIAGPRNHDFRQRWLLPCVAWQLKKPSKMQHMVGENMSDVLKMMFPNVLQCFTSLSCEIASTHDIWRRFRSFPSMIFVKTISQLKGCKTLATSFKHLCLLGADFFWCSAVVSWHLRFNDFNQEMVILNPGALLSFKSNRHQSDMGRILQPQNS